MSEVLIQLSEKDRGAKPEFDGGAFSISHFSPSPHGFEVQTRNILRRRDGPSKGIVLDEDKKNRLKTAMQGEMKFNGVQVVKDARKAWLNSKGSEEEAADLENKFYDERKKYQAKGKKLGIRNIGIDGNMITADVKFVSFPVYNQFARPEDGAALIDLSANAAGAMIVRSKDGRLVIQHRAVAKQRLTEPKLSRGNAQFTDIPGASVAGMLDASLDRKDREPGTPDPVDTSTVKGGILKEAGEELGLGSEDLGEVRIVGLAHDRIKIHDEFLLLADSHLTAEEIREKSRKSNKNKNLGDADFEEKFIDIDGSADSILTLLTEVKCPLPPTHAAALVASGYSLVLQEQGKDAADAWKDEVQQGVQRNYKEIDQQVTAYYDKYPEVLTQIPERFWGKKHPNRKLHGYDPAFTPEEQGLPSFEDAMVESGLMPETRRHVGKAYLFDVDGVLSDPVEKKVTEHEVFDQIIARLQQRQPVGLNTGRSTAWMVERFINPLLEKIEDKTILENFVAIGEKGGTWITFDEQGEMQHGKSLAIAVPDEVKEKARELVEDRYGDSMFIDDTKETMLSIEMHDGLEIPTFTEIQQSFVNDLQNLLVENGVEGSYHVDPTTIATDVESPYVGKALGADRFEEFLRDKGIIPAEYDTFGDSQSDFAMADELSRRGKHVKMVYVGDSTTLGDLQKDYPIDYIGGFSQGTVTYLRSS